MKIQLVSFPVYSRLTRDKVYERIELIAKILNESSADFVMFSEHVLKDLTDLRVIRNLINRRSVSAFIELNESKELNGNRMYLLQDGEWKYIDSQIFAESRDANETNIEYLVHEIDGKFFTMRRQFKVAGKKFMVIHCGENNILKGSSGIAEFRLKKRPDLEERFEKRLNDVDIVLNPVHTKWGYFSKFLTRIRKFSENGRYCFSSSQTEGSQLENAIKSPGHNTTHIAMHNSEIIDPISTEVVNAGKEQVLIQTYEID